MPELTLQQFCSHGSLHWVGMQQLTVLKMFFSTQRSPPQGGPTQHIGTFLPLLKHPSASTAKLWGSQEGAVPVGCENVQGRRLVTLVVNVSNRVGNAVLGDHLLVLDGRAFERFLHVDIL